MPSSRDIYLKELMNQLLYQSLSKASFTVYVWPPEDKDQLLFFLLQESFYSKTSHQYPKIFSKKIILIYSVLTF